MVPTDGQVTPDTGVEAYMLNYFDALTALQEAGDDLARKARDMNVAPSERASAAAACLDMTRVVAHLKAAHDGFLQAHAGTANPPSAALVDESLRLSAALARDIAAAQQAVAVLEVAKTFVDGWARMLGAQAGAPAMAGRMGAAVAPRRPDVNVERALQATNMEFLGVHLGRS